MLTSNETIKVDFTANRIINYLLVVLLTRHELFSSTKSKMESFTRHGSVIIMNDESIDEILIEFFKKKVDSPPIDEKLKRLLTAEAEANQEAYQMWLIGRKIN